MNNLKLISLAVGSSLVTGSIGLLIGSALQSKIDGDAENITDATYHQVITDLEGELQDKKIQLQTLQEELEEKEDELQHLKELNTERRCQNHTLD